MYPDNKNALIGQTQINNRLANLTLKNLPHSILLIGEEGCGKHTLCKIIADKFDLQLKELDNNINQEDIDNIVFKPYLCLYFINLDNAIPKLQNNLLKFLEEPISNIYIICITSNINNVLPTLSNRCQRWYFEKYAKEELKKFITNSTNEDLILKIFDTPGQIIKGQDHPLQEMENLANTMIDRIAGASVSNILSISDNKIAWKNEQDKFNINIFLKVLEETILEKIKNNDDKKYYNIFHLINNLKSKLNLCISQQQTFEGFLMELKEISNAST